MIFSLQNLNLQSGAYGEDFDIIRGDCFHSGKDYTTNKVPTEFSAAIYGKVVSIGADWGSIGVQPFGTSDLVQYLHCSEIYVAVGDIVAPWTKLGKTGDVCPPGRCNGIHLHLHVVRNSGSPKYNCWSRNYVDPNTWTYVNPILGTWHSYVRTQGSPGSNVSYHEMSSNLIIVNDVIPTPNQLIKVWTLHVQSRVGTCTIYVTFKYSIVFTGVNGNAINFTCTSGGHTIQVVNGTGTCMNMTVNPAPSGNGTLAFKDANTLNIGGSSALAKGYYDRTGNYFLKFDESAFGSQQMTQVDEVMLILNDLNSEIIEIDNHGLYGS